MPRSTAHAALGQLAVCCGVEVSPVGQGREFSADRVPIRLGVDPVVDILRCLGNGHVSRLLRPSIHNLDEPLCKLLPDRDAVGDTDQVGILELHAGTFVAIVEHGIESHGLHAPNSSSAALALRRVGIVHGRNHHFERSDRGRQRHAILVVVQLDGGAEDSLHADAVGPMMTRYLFAGLAEDF